MLSFAAKCFDGKVPQPGELDAEERALLPKVEAGFQTVSELSQERLKVPRRPARSDGPGPRGQRVSAENGHPLQKPIAQDDNPFELLGLTSKSLSG
jgi:hypothetical protein